MKMVPYNRKEIPAAQHYKSTKNLKVLEEFMNSGADCVQLVDHGYANAKSCYSALRVSAIRFGFAGVQVIIRGEDVFLAKKEL